MVWKRRWFQGWWVASVLLIAGCQDAPAPTAPLQPEPSRSVAPQARSQARGWLARSSPEVLALPGTVFAAGTPSGGVVIGVEHERAMPAVLDVLGRLGVPESARSVRVVEPIHRLAGLRDEHRPTLGGVQIHFSRFLCTLGFNVDHAGGRSFVTNSHCTDRQGESTGTVYYQPTSSIAPSPIGIEADDPEYSSSLPGCSRGKKCRYSDAARVLYESGVKSLHAIARTGGANGGSLEVVGDFDVTSQDDATTEFTGTLDKIGRTTGWTRGTVATQDGADLTCVNVNVSRSNVQLLCQTLVQNDEVQIAGAGDSGSPVFRTTGSDTAELVGILWGGSSSGNLFVFSPLKNIQDELGALDATADGTGDGSGSDGTGGGTCPPGNPGHKNCG